MMAKATPALLLIALSFSASVGCKNAKPATKNSIDTGLATINLSAVTKSNQTQTFREVTRASLLPKAVLDQFGGMADPGQPFNTTDVVDPKRSMQQLVVAAVSEQYCIVSYWQGGITLSFETKIFELSGGSPIDRIARNPFGTQSPPVESHAAYAVRYTTHSHFCPIQQPGVSPPSAGPMSRRRHNG